MTKTSVHSTIKAPVSQAGLKGALLHMAVSHRTLSKYHLGGGEADVEEKITQGTVDHILVGANDNFTYHKSVLAVRLVPERLTDIVC